MITVIPTTGANGSTILPRSMWTTSSVGGAGTVDINTNSLRMLTGATGGYADHVRAMSVFVLGNDFDIRMRVTPSQAWSNEMYFHLGVGQAYWAATEPSSVRDGWDLTTDGVNSIGYLQEYDASALTQSINGAHTFAGSEATWLKLVRRGGRFWSTVWADGNPEPAAPDAALSTTNFKTVTPMFIALGLGAGNAAAARGISVDRFTIDDKQVDRRRGSLAAMVGGTGR